MTRERFDEEPRALPTTDEVETTGASLEATRALASNLGEAWDRLTENDKAFISENFNDPAFIASVEQARAEGQDWMVFALRDRSVSLDLRRPEPGSD